MGPGVSTRTATQFIDDLVGPLVLSPAQVPAGAPEPQQALSWMQPNWRFDSMVGPFNPTSTYYYFWAAEKALSVSEDDGLGGAVYAEAFGDRNPAALDIPRNRPHTILTSPIRCSSGRTPTEPGAPDTPAAPPVGDSYQVRGLPFSRWNVRSGACVWIPTMMAYAALTTTAPISPTPTRRTKTKMESVMPATIVPR